MKRVIAIGFSSWVALAAGFGCGSDPHPTGDVEGPSGSAELSITAVPADAACLKVVTSGSRTVTRLFDLVPGTSPTFAIDRLPVGVVQFDGQAYSTACSKIGAASVPTFVSEAPVSVRIDPVAIAKLALKLIRNGRVSVSVDFEAPAWLSTSRDPIDVAVFGDVPYGPIQIADFPKYISDINAATPPVKELLHVGDIKNGSSTCDTPYFQFVLDNLNASNLPLLYTPGDNEWTDCHRANNGAYDPLERLGTIRSMFFPVPGSSLGMHHKEVLTQSLIAGFETFVENQLWVEAGTLFTMVHVVGSNNSLLPWYTDDMTHTKVDDPARRTAEVAARTAADLDWLDRSFDEAKRDGVAGVVILMQANMWDGTPTNGFDTTIQRIASQTIAFGKPVLLIEGDSHVFLVDNPLAMGDAAHGVTTPVPNLTRLVVQGSTTTPLPEWLRLHVDPAAAMPFSWTRNPR